MNIENIKALAEITSRYGLTALEVAEGEIRIRIEKEAARHGSPLPGSPEMTAAAEPDAGSYDNGGDAGDTGAQSVNFNRLIEVKSPLVGVFYSAPSPDSETFVSIGSKVKKGDVLCIIETMKLMNDVTAEQDGEIVDICIKSGDIVEYGQVLFKMF